VRREADLPPYDELGYGLQTDDAHVPDAYHWPPNDRNPEVDDVVVAIDPGLRLDLHVRVPFVAVRAPNLGDGRDERGTVEPVARGSSELGRERRGCREHVDTIAARIDLHHVE
jgi:hypothetical protein